MRQTLAFCALATLVFFANAPCPAAEVSREEGPAILSHLPQDPVAVSVMTVEDLNATLDGFIGFLGRLDGEVSPDQVQAKIAEFDEKLGCSIRGDLLAPLGPEFALVIDLPPIDEIAASMAVTVDSWKTALGRVALVAGVRDADALDGCLRKLFDMAEATAVEYEGLVRIAFPVPGQESAAGAQEGATGGPQEFHLYYGFRDGMFALGVSPVFVSASLRPLGEGLRLADGGDFSRVFAQLDSTPESLGYINLPKVREMVLSSQFLQSVLGTNAEARPILDLLAMPELTGMGLGTTTVSVDEGTRTTTFAPSGLSGGMASTGIIAAIAIPNLLNAVDRGKQKRTMADLRSIGTVCEAYAIDNNRYPGPTEDWVEVSEVASFVEPVYIRTMPTIDGWGHPLMFWSDGESYLIVSPGKDGEMMREWRGEIEPGGTTHFGADIVFGDGQFLAWPEGTQQ